MKKAKKILAIIFTISILLGMVVVPSNATTVQSGSTMPDGFVAFDDFENTTIAGGSVKDGWLGSYATVASSTTYSYGNNGKSMEVALTATGSAAGAYIYGCEYKVTGDGLAFWLYIPGEVPANKNFEIDVYLGTALGDKDNANKYTVNISTNNLTTGEQVITIPWTDLTATSPAYTFETENICITKIQLRSNAGNGFTYYIDQFGFYGVLPLAMPDGFVAFDDFENTTIAGGSVKDGWLGSYATVASNTTYSYGNNGKSIQVALTATGSAAGAYIYGCEHKVTGDGLAFWLYIPGEVPANKNFEIDVYLGTALGDKDNANKYTVNISTNNLTTGEQVITIPWTDLTATSPAYTFETENICITKIQFRSNAGTGFTYYIDQLGFYGVQPLAMPDGFVAFDDFENTTIAGGNVQDGWLGSYATVASNSDYSFGNNGKSMQVALTATGSAAGAYIYGCEHKVTGDGLAFWLYIPGEIPANKNFEIDVYLGTALGDKDNANKYTVNISTNNLTTGEQVITIPWTDLTATSPAYTFETENICITKIQLRSNAGTGFTYYIDQFGFYGIPKNLVTMPEEGFVLIDDYEDNDSLSWSKHNNATFELTDTYGYGKESKSAHITITSNGFNGIKSKSNANIVLKGDGITFWAYNASSALNKFYVVLTQNSTNYQAMITLEQGENYYEIPWADFIKQNDTLEFDEGNGAVTQIQMYAHAATGEFYIDQLGFYNVQPHTLEIPEGFVAIEGFESEGTNWKALNKSTWTPSTAYGYFSSAHVTWTEHHYNGIHSGSSNANISLKGDGFTFWVFNDGAELSDFIVTLTQNGTNYDTTVTLTQGEGLYTIPWSDFGAIDISKTVSEIKLQHLSASGDIYIDQIGFYGVPIIETFEDFENGFENLGWEAVSHATLEESTDYTYDGSASSAHVYWDIYGYSGLKTSSKKELKIVSSDEGVVLWAYNAGEQIDDFYVRLTNQYTVTYEAKTTLKTGGAVYKIPYSEFKHMENAEKSFNVGDTITQFEIVMKSTSANCYFDSIGFYKNSLPASELPTNYTVIDDFEVGMTGSGTIGWKAFSDATAEISREYSSEVDGGKRSLKVGITSGNWRGVRATPSEYVYNNDAIAFELYITSPINSKQFTFNVTLNSDSTKKYDIFINTADLEIGKNLIKIPFEELINTTDKETKLSSVVQPTDKISGIEFTAVADATYYIDNIVIYESAYSTQTMPYTYSVIEDFNRDNARLEGALNATVESSTKHRYGNMGKAARAYWEENVLIGENRASGIKCILSENSRPTVKTDGAGIAFWAYNNGDGLNWFAVKLLSGDKYYEAIIQLDKGEGVYTIPYSRFVYELDHNEKLPTDATVTQIEFLSINEYATDFYIDEVAAYYMDSVDVNFDSSVDNDDIFLARYILLGLEPECAGLSDTNEDGVVNICDLVEIDNYLSNDNTASSEATVVADYTWHPGLIDRDVSYDLAITVDGETTTTAILSCDNQDVTIDGYKVTIPYSVRASGNDLILTVSDSLGNYLGTINIPCKSWTQSFGDEFAQENGSAFDANKWGNSSSCSTTPTDGKTYTENDRAGMNVNAYEIKNGKLVMKVTDEDCYSGTNQYNYSEFCINTKDSFRQEYGLFEANIATTGVEGVNTAFWLLPYGSIPEQFTTFKQDDPSYGLSEIDILETPMYNGNQVAQINEHYYDYLNNNDHISFDGTGENKFIVDNIEQQHTYSCAWLESGIYYYIDNELVYLTTDVQPESEDGEKVVRRAYMIIDVSYQGPDSWLGTAPDNFDTLVANGDVHADVDWIRAYK